MIEYPTGWERTAQTRDGAAYRIRPIRSDDAQRDREFIVGLSEQSRYKRMMGAVREPARSLLDRFVNVDYRRNMAFVAVIGSGTDERIIGVARYAADARGPECEFAVAVSDAWQGRGIGATLTQLLFEYARLQGFRRLHGDVLVNNHEMVELVHWLGMDTRRSAADPTVLEATRAL